MHLKSPILFQSSPGRRHSVAAGMDQLSRRKVETSALCCTPLHRDTSKYPWIPSDSAKKLLARRGSCRTWGSAASASGGPWTTIFDLRERETTWSDENKTRLVKVIAKIQLGVSLEELEHRLQTLLVLIPDLERRVTNMPPRRLAALVTDIDVVAQGIITLRALLPGADVGAIAASAPELLSPDRVATLPEDMRDIQALLEVDGPGLGHLAEVQPLLLDAELVGEVLHELQLLLDLSPDAAAATLKRDPSWILRVQRGQRHLGVNPDEM